MKDSVLIDKSIHFAARIIKLHKYLVDNKKESIISKALSQYVTDIYMVLR